MEKDSRIPQAITMHDRIFAVYRRRLQIFSKQEMQNVYRESVPLSAEYGWSKEPVPYAERGKLEYRPAQVGLSWAHEWESAWFHVWATVPESFAGRELCLRVNLGGEACVFDETGTPAYGLTGMSAFDTDYYKDRYVIGSFAAGTRLEYWIEGAANGLFGINQPAATDRNPAKPQGSYTATISQLSLCVFDRELYGMLFDFRVLDELLDVYGMNDYRGKQLLNVLNRAMDMYAGNPANATAVRAYLKEKWLSHPASASALTACAVGHAHIDVGWLWPVRESIRKCGRTFSSQLALMEKYPDYIFGASQAELYKMTKDNYPELFRKIARRIAEGRWEVQGAWWVEADCNIISGESMCRQFLHGKNFFRDEFGVDVRNLWIPDVFGYSASLPQMIRKAGCDHFLTQKISWSQFNTFPHNTFRWVGIDGTEVLTHFPPEDTYNARAMPRERISAANRFREAGCLDRFASLIGIGDGGGGPSERYLEASARVSNLEGCPKAVFRRAEDFFRDIEPQAAELPVWQGELYLELHRGTLTTQAHTKRNNRKCEQALTALEFLASCLPADQYPAEMLDACWKKVLLNQFHDIIPGSSIGLVYQTTEKEHAMVLARCAEEMRKAADTLFRPCQDAAVLVNTLPTAWQGCVELPPDWRDGAVADDEGVEYDTQVEDGRVVAYVDIPGSSFLTLRLRRGEGQAAELETAGERVLENDLIRYEFDGAGQLVSAIDKRDGRELMTAPGNVLSLYADQPLNHEAWDVDIYYPRDFRQQLSCTSAGMPQVGPCRSFLTFTFEGPASKVTQTVVLGPDSTRLDFVTHVDWHEYRTMLRTAFPVAVAADQAVFDIQYGYVRRPTHNNTSWDEAKFETAGQRYADLSQDDYGVALLNDCKYGYRVKGSVLDLNLLRSPKHPDYNADMGEHDMTYSLYPHAGDHIAGAVPEQAAMLNRDVHVALNREAGAADVPCQVLSDSVNLEVLKRAEKDDSLILRLVETAGRHSAAVLRLADPKARVSETNLIEWERGKALDVSADGQVELRLKPSEILTLRPAR